MSGWIGVHDMLPAEGSVVLCWDVETEWIHAAKFGREGQGEFWRNDEGRSLWDVTHWQPAPEKPSEE